jgi:hypothetical protein
MDAIGVTALHTDRTASRTGDGGRQDSRDQAQIGRGGGTGGTERWKTQVSSGTAIRQPRGSITNPESAGGVGNPAPRVIHSLLRPRHFCVIAPMTQREPDVPRAEASPEQQDRDLPALSSEWQQQHLPSPLSSAGQPQARNDVPVCPEAGRGKPMTEPR